MREAVSEGLLTEEEYEQEKSKLRSSNAKSETVSNASLYEALHAVAAAMANNVSNAPKHAVPEAAPASVRGASVLPVAKKARLQKRGASKSPSTITACM